MNEFLSYEILGLITVQTYLIVAAIDLILCSAFNKKNKPFSKLVAQALIWPLNFVIVVVLFAFGCMLALVTLLAKVFGR